MEAQRDNTYWGVANRSDEPFGLWGQKQHARSAIDGLQDRAFAAELRVIELRTVDDNPQADERSMYPEMTFLSRLPAGWETVPDGLHGFIPVQAWNTTSGWSLAEDAHLAREMAYEHGVTFKAAPDLIKHAQQLRDDERSANAAAIQALKDQADARSTEAGPERV